MVGYLIWETDVRRICGLCDGVWCAYIRDDSCLVFKSWTNGQRCVFCGCCTCAGFTFEGVFVLVHDTGVLKC